MALTTVVRGRAYDWSHAIGRGAATGTGFNYVQTMCLGNDGDLYTANRGNENNFGMRVNQIKLGGPGEEELLAEFFAARRRGRQLRPGRSASPSASNDQVYCSDEWTEHDLGVRQQMASSSAQMGQDRQRRRRVAAPGRPGRREERQRHRRRQRQQSAAGVHPGRQVGRQVRQGRHGRWRVQPALGHHARQGRQHLRRRLEEPPRAEAVAAGQVPDDDRQYGEVPAAGGCLCRDLSRTVHLEPAGIRTIPRPGCSTIRPMSRWIRTATSTSPTGATIGSAIFEADGTPLTNLIGDAQVMSKWGQQSVDANPDMMKAYRRVQNLEPLWRFCFPTAVDFNPETDEIIVADSQRNRLQVYKKVRDYGLPGEPVAFAEADTPPPPLGRALGRSAAGFGR